MTGGDDLEALSEEATANTELGESADTHEVTRSTYGSVQAGRTRGETRVVTTARLGTETDPEEPTEPLPSPTPPPRRRRGLYLLLAIIVLVLGSLCCLGLATVWFLLPTSPPSLTVAESIPELEAKPRADPPPPAPTAPALEPAAATPPTPQAAAPAAHTDPAEPKEPAPEPTEPPPDAVTDAGDADPYIDANYDADIDLSDVDPGPSELSISAPAEPSDPAPPGRDPVLLIGALSLTGPGSEPQLRNVMVLAESDLLACYEDSLQQGPMEATLSLNMRLLADGTVLGARARERREEVPVLSLCVERVMLSQRFPGLTGAVSLTVPLSFVLKVSSTEN